MNLKAAPGSRPPEVGGATSQYGNYPFGDFAQGPEFAADSNNNVNCKCNNSGMISCRSAITPRLNYSKSYSV